MRSCSPSSMPSASAGKVSVMRFIHNKCMGRRSVNPNMVAANTAITSARLLESKNCIAFRILS